MAWHGRSCTWAGRAGILAVGCWSATRILAISLGSLLLAKLNRMAPLVGKNGCEAEKRPSSGRGLFVAATMAVQRQLYKHNSTLFQRLRLKNGVLLDFRENVRFSEAGLANQSL